MPAPLCYVSEIFHCVSQYEVFILLSVIWNFIKVCVLGFGLLVMLCVVFTPPFPRMEARYKTEISG